MKKRADKHADVTARDRLVLTTDNALFSSSSAERCAAIYREPRLSMVSAVNCDRSIVVVSDRRRDRMKRSSGLFLLLLFVVLLSSKEMAVPAEARLCESKSHHFKGACSGDHNCAIVCRTEGFSGGNCKGFRRRCFCTRLC